MSDVARMKAAEKAAMDAVKKQDEKVAKAEASFNFVKGQKLPEGFVNPPCGEQDHRCVDRSGNYQPDYVQVLIEKIYDKQVNPQPFPLAGVTYLVNLDEWTDCPPGVLESLKSAVETHHDYNATAGQIQLGQHPEHKRIERKRFVYRSFPSA